MKERERLEFSPKWTLNDSKALTKSGQESHWIPMNSLGNTGHKTSNPSAAARKTMEGKQNADNCMPHARYLFKQHADRCDKVDSPAILNSALTWVSNSDLNLLSIHSLSFIHAGGLCKYNLLSWVDLGWSKDTGVQRWSEGYSRNCQALSRMVESCHEVIVSI